MRTCSFCYRTDPEHMEDCPEYKKAEKLKGCGGCHECLGIHCMIYHPGHSCRSWLYDFAKE